MECNLPVFRLPAGSQTLYFFPNALMVYDKNNIGVVPYQMLRAETKVIRFTDDERVPSDATIVAKTWLYVNKDGGPDRRFRDNRELPIVQYSSLSLKSDTGLNELFHTSRTGVVQAVAEALIPVRGLSFNVKLSVTVDYPPNFAVDASPGTA